MLFIKKITATIIIILTLFTPLYQTHAIWSNVASDFGVASYKQMLEEIRSQIVKAIEAAAKMMAIKQATSTIEDLLYGGSSSPRNIKNFQDFLVQKPHDKTIAYAQDFLTNSLRGSTSSDYTPAGGSGSGNNLSASLKAAGESVIAQWKGEGLNYDAYRNACSGLSNPFAGENLDCYNAIINTAMPIKVALDMDALMSAKYQEEQEKAKLEAVSSGVLPAKDESGNITNPKSIVEEIQLQRIKLPLEALANGDSSAFSSLIQSFAVSLIVGVVERGLGEVESSAQENIKAFERQYQEQIGQYYDKIGPALNYADNTYDTAKKFDQQTTLDNDAGANNASSQTDASHDADNPTQQ